MLKRKFNYRPVLFLLLGFFFFLNHEASASYLTAGDSQWSNNGTSIYYNDGNVGVGTTTPSAKLHVTGNSYLNGNATTSGLIYISSAANASGNIGFSATNPYIVAPSYITITNGLYVSNTSASSYFGGPIRARGVISNDTSPYLTISGGTSTATYFPGTVGIGVAAPQAIFAIKGGEEVTSISNARASSSLWIEGYSGSSWGTAFGSYSGQIQYLQGMDRAQTTGRVLALNPFGGNISVGTTSVPTNKVLISGGALDVINVAGGFISGLNSTPINNDQAVPLGYLKSNYTQGGVSGSGTANYVTKWSATGTLANSLFYDNGTNVGLGTTVPGVKFDVVGGAIRTNNQLVSTVAIGTAPLAVTSNTAVSNLNADLLDGLHSTTFQQRVGYGTTAGNSGYYKINILPATSWMLSFTIRLYQDYRYDDIRISGYNYGANYWYTPLADLLNSSATSIPVQFGYDSAFNLWVAVPAGTYTGLEIIDITNGYTQANQDWSKNFTIVNQTLLTGTVQATQTVYRPLKYNENAVSATTLQTARTIWGQSFNGSANISGAITGATTGTFSGNLTVAGNVGIASTTPNFKLGISGVTGDVINVGGGSISGLNLTPVNNDQAVPLGYLKTNYTQGSVSGSGTGGYISKWAGAAATSTIGNSNIYTNGTDIGVGTTVPNSSIHILAASPILRLANSSAVSSTTIGQIDFSDSYQPTNAEARISAVRTVTGSGGNNPADLVFSVMNGATLGEALRINSAGNVGIGTTNPNTILHIKGTSPILRVEASGGSQEAQLHLDASDNTGSAGIYFTRIEQSDAYAGKIGWTGGTSGNFTFSTGGASLTEKIRITNSGSVGIGTTSPIQKLHVVGNSYFNGNAGIGITNPVSRLHVSTLGTGDGALGQRWSYNSQDSAYYLDLKQTISSGIVRWNFSQVNNSIAYDNVLVLDRGNVGLGTTAPGALLDVSKLTGSATIAPSTIRISTQTSASDWSTADPWGVLDFYSADGAKTHARIGVLSYASSGGNSNLAFYTESSGLNERMRITALGNVGIASTTPSVKLAIAGGTGDVVNVGGGHIIGLNITPATSTAAVPLSYLQNNYAPISGSVKGGGTGGYMTKWAGTGATSTIAQGLVYDNGTNIGIGTTTPLMKLEVIGGSSLPATSGTTPSGAARFTSGSAGVSSVLDIGSYNSSGAGWIQATDRGSLATNYALLLNPNGGNVGIGTTTPGFKLDVVGSGIRNYHATDPYLLLSQGTNNAYLENYSGKLHIQARNLPIYFETDSSYTIPKMMIGTDGNVGIGTTTPSKALSVVGSALISETLTVGLTGTGKIYGGSVDPPYTIGGRKYATYAPSMTGIKEETAGVATLKYTGQKDLYSYDLDLKNPALASDLWLFSKVTNLKKEGLNKVSVLLSAHFDGRIWYEKNETSGLITIYAVPLEKKFIPEVSYRLTAPRFDSLNYPSERPASDEIEGFNLDKLLK